MRVSLKKFTRDPYKYVKKAPLLILLGDYPRYAVIPYHAYKTHFLDSQPNQPKTEKGGIQVVTNEEPKKTSWLWRLLFE